PIERLVEVAELVETRLAAAVDLEDVADLLTLVVTARKVAYQRTGAPVHLCQVLAAAEQVSARPGLSSGLAAEAGEFAREARSGLATHADAPCLQPQPEEPTKEPGPQPAVMPGPKAAPMSVTSEGRRADGLTIAGGVLLGTAGVVALGLLGVRVYRLGPYQEHLALVADAEAAGGRSPAQDLRMYELDVIRTRTQQATIGLAVSGAVFAVVGAALLGTGLKRPSSTRARVVPFGGPYAAGIELRARF
ncbi:hypothetical protein ACOXH8_45895, partial [Nannocystis pusilla]